MLDDAGGDVADVGTLLADGGQAAFVLSKAVRLWELGKGGVGGAGLLKGIDLLEEIKVALVAALEGLIGLFAAKDMDGALEEDESVDDNTARERNQADLAETRVFCCAEGIPVVVVGRAHEPGKEL